MRLRIAIVALGALGALLAAAAPLPGDSIYQLGSTWTDARGRAVPLGSLRGHVLVAAMVYTSCPAICPVTVSDLRRIERGLDAAARKGVRFVLFSLDPERDTPAELAAFAEKRGLAGDRWVLLTAPPDRVRELAAVLGVQYRRVGGGEFAHSNLISVIDAEGRIRHRQVGLRKDDAPAVRKIEELVAAARAATP